MKRMLALLLSLAMAFALVACGGNNTAGNNTADGGNTAGNQTEDTTGGDTAEATGSVYYMNFKPEQDAQWQELAAYYTEQTGVPVTVATYASGEYETMLTSEMAKDEAPTLFQVNGPVGLNNWRDYCYDLSGSAVYGELTSDDYALMDGDSVAGIAYVIESYGIIVNTALLSQAGYTVDDIQSFEDLKAVAEDITARKDELGFSAFTSAGLDSSSDWRFKTHLANLPIYFEYQDEGITSTDAIKGTYLDNYKNIWDLYINNATCEPALLSTKTGDDAVAEFVTGQAVFYQNGTWEYAGLVEAGLAPENLAMIPIYCGVDGEENAGLCSGTENCWAINSQVSAEDQKASMDFLVWLVTDETAAQKMVDTLGALPFKSVPESSNVFLARSEERRVGKECRSRWSPYH